MKKLFYLIAFPFFLIACASSTEEGAVGIKRKQFLFGVSEDQVNKLALQEYTKVKDEASAKKTLDTNSEYVRRVQSVAKKLIPHTAVFRSDAPSWAWETHVVTSKELNAYCMPGGKIVFYSGIIEKLNMTDGEMAAVMGHEIAHALREHGRERISQVMAEQLALGVGVASGKISEQTAQYAGVASQLLLNLPNSRAHESEADDIGVELMARAGYDPQEAVNLWVKMSKAGGGSAAFAFLSTHPSDEKRIKNIQALIPKVQPLYLGTKK